MTTPLRVPAIRDLLPLTDMSAETVSLAVRNIITGQENVLRIEVDARNQAVVFWRIASTEEVRELPVVLGECLRHLEMEEYLVDNTPKSVLAQLCEACEMLEDAGFVPSHILSGVGPQELRKHLRISRRARLLFGIPLHYLSTVDVPALFLCGAERRDASPEDLRYAIKVGL